MSNIVKKINPDIPEPITKIIKAATEATTGLTIRYADGKLATLGEFAQHVITDGLIRSVGIELERLRKDGRVKDEYFSTLQARYNLSELLKYLDSETPTEKKFEILKNILLVASTQEISNSEDIKPQQYMQLIKDLPGGSVLILATCYKISQGDFREDGNGQIFTDEWRKIIAKESGLGSYDLVCNYEEILEKKRLINIPAGVEKVYVRVNPSFRLTDLGFDLMDYANHLED